jgi:biopolymer transport protein ExbD
MAEIQAAAASHGTKPRVKKHAFRLDMTPMVDLAFLLLTFFMLTTTFAKPNVMDLAMPAKGKTSDVPARNALTLLLGNKSQVHYFFGLNDEQDAPDLHTTNLGVNGLRQVLLQRRQQQPGTVVLIKTAAGAKYRDLVDVLDEMSITEQEKYAVVDATPADYALLKKHGW